MPRPSKEVGTARTITVRVRCTTIEKSQLVASAKSRGMTISDLLRTTALNAAPLFRKATPERAAFIKGLAELGKIGSNINQIARVLNTDAKKEAFTITAEQISQALERVDFLAHHLSKVFTDGD